MSHSRTNAVLMGAILQAATPAWAQDSNSNQDTNTIQIIKEMERRISELEKTAKKANQRSDDLEQKLKALERQERIHEQDQDTKAKERNEAAEPKIKALERDRELEQTAAAEAPKKGPTVSLGDNGLVVGSRNSNFLMNIHGYIQVDGRFYPSGTADDTFLLRRVRPIIEGTVYKNFDYRFMADFGSGNVSSSTALNNAVIDDAYVNARFWPQAQIQVGKFKSPVGLERLQSTAENLFVENGFATQMTPNYDLGVQIHNTLFNTTINYAIGIFNGAIDGGSDDMDITDKSKDLEGRLFFQPFLRTGPKALGKLGFGVGGSVGNHAGQLPSYRTPGQQTFFTYTNGATANGQQYRIDPQFYYYWGPFGLMGEYIVSSQEVKGPGSTLGTARFDNRAWQVEASLFLTGDENSFRATSRHLFHPKHPLGEGLGAFELVGRVQQLSLDDDAFPNFATAASAQEATSWGIGLNWYLNSNLRLYADYESTWFRGGGKTSGTVTAKDEHVILGRVQVGF